MGTEEKDKGTFSELTEILDKTKDLTVLLKETESYRNYCQSLEKLKARPELYKELNGFRRKNLELQVQDDAADYDDKT